jgi:amino acid transporter
VPTEGDGSYLGAFLAASLLGLYLFYGFEACGDVAEEVPDPGRTIPKAMRRAIYVGGAAALLITAALILAQPDFAGIISGENADPVGNVLSDVFGGVGSKVITVIVLISFVSCLLSLQAAASRLIFSYARDHMVFASDALARFSPTRHVPPR